MANSLARDVLRVLTTALGDFIASATLKKNCELIGTTLDELTASQLPELAVEIEKSVGFFADSVTASTVAQKILDLKG